jgi:hypothetical protein
MTSVDGYGTSKEGLAVKLLTSNVAEVASRNVNACTLTLYLRAASAKLISKWQFPYQS